MTSSAWHWHLVNREALRGPPEPFRFAAGHPGSISAVFYPRGHRGECRVDVLPTVDMKTGPRESHVPGPTEAPSEKEVQCSLIGMNGDPRLRGRRFEYSAGSCNDGGAHRASSTCEGRGEAGPEVSWERWLLT